MISNAKYKPMAVVDCFARGSRTHLIHECIMEMMPLCVDQGNKKYLISRLVSDSSYHRYLRRTNTLLNANCESPPCPEQVEIFIKKTCMKGFWFGDFEKWVKLGTFDPVLKSV